MQKQQLRFMKDDYKSILEAIDDAAFLIDSRKEVIAMNTAAVNLINKRESVTSEPNAGNLSKGFLSGFGIDRLLTKLAETNSINEKIYDDLTDTHYAVKLSKVFTKDAANNEQWLMLIKDITEFKKAKQNELEYKILVENQGEGIGTTDEKEIFVFANAAAEEIFGVEKNGLLNRCVDEFVSKEVFEKIHSETNKRKAGHKSSYEIEIQRPDGRRRTILVTATPRFDQQGKFLNSFGIFRDITEQKRAEQELMNHQKMLRLGLAYQETISKIALNFNAVYNFQKQVNEALKIIGELISVSRVYIFKNTNEGESMTNIFEWCNQGIEPQIEQLQNIPYSIIPSWKRILQEEGIIVAESIHELPDDIVKILEPQAIISIIAFPVNIGKEFYGFIGFDECKRKRSWSKAEVELLRTVAGIISNVFERQIMENNLKEAKEKAEESDRLKSAFLANMSHEIRTPMNGIIGFSDLLMNPKLREEQRSYYAKIVSDSCRQLLSIVTDILDLSRIETRQVKVKSEKTSLNGLITEVYRFYKHKVGDRNISILPIKDLEDSASMVYADRTKVYQVLHHLMNNAVKFTQKGYVKFGYQVNARYIEFFVKDTGIGIPANLHKEVFEPFRQAELEATREYGGTGLGLTIAQKTVHLLHGDMWVESEVNKGSTFYFTIPYEPVVEEIQEHSGEDKSEDIHFSDIKVLVAEDEEFNFIYFEELLSEWGMQVTHARNGKEAVDFCKSDSNIDLVFMDIKMPKLNGLDATRLIKEIKPGLTVIAQTAYAMLEDRQKAIEAGCDDYITKPIDRDKLIEILKKYRDGMYT